MKFKNPFVGVTSIWHERYLECSRVSRTPRIYDSVMRYYDSLIDLDHSDKAIYSKVKPYYEEWEKEVDERTKLNTRDTMDDGIKDTERDIQRMQLAPKLFRFINQTIQDSGVGFQTFSDVDADSSDYDESI